MIWGYESNQYLWIIYFQIMAIWFRNYYPIEAKEILPMSSIWKSKKISDKKIIEWS